MEDGDYLVPASAVKWTAAAAYRLIGGLCEPILADMEDGSVDHVITDPPYGEVTHKGARGGGMDQTKLVNFDCLSDDGFLSMSRQCVRVARRWVVMTCEWRHAVVVEREMPDEFVRLGVWIKPDGAPQFTGDRPGTGWEAIMILHRLGKKRWNGEGKHAVYRILKHTIGSGVDHHPCQKPIELLRKWVRDFTDPGEHVLDPFAGSGTTGEACLSEGRNVTLIEKDPRWCEFIRRRLNKPFPKMASGS